MRTSALFLIYSLALAILLSVAVAEVTHDARVKCARVFSQAVTR
jgi:hypothetical protein